MTPFEKLLKQYDYEFPAKLIAQAPAHPRDSARLLVYDRATKTITHDTFKNLVRYLPKNCVLVLNQTKVVPARLTVTKPTGGHARILYIKHDEGIIKTLSDRKLEVGTTVHINKNVSFTVLQRDGQFYTLKPSFQMKHLFRMLETYGQPPLPPYIKHSPLRGGKLKQEYQTVFAKQAGSVAAPTASLHFTPQLLKNIQKAGIKIVYVTLHVNLGTFAPITEEHMKRGKLHHEWYSISPRAAQILNKAKRNKQPIIAAGTTVVRTLESAAKNKGELTKLEDSTDLFITEHHKLRFIDHLITNFHVPKSSLMMLVSALTGRKQLLEVYQEAIKKKYRLFSFGDGMLVL